MAKETILYIDDESMKGIYNATGPNPVTNKEMMKMVAKVMKKPMFLPNVPAFVLKMILGEMASMILGGNRVSSEKIESEGFEFKYPDLENALENLLKA